MRCLSEQFEVMRGPMMYTNQIIQFIQIHSEMFQSCIVCLLKERWLMETSWITLLQKQEANYFIILLMGRLELRSR